MVEGPRLGGGRGPSGAIAAAHTVLEGRLRRPCLLNPELSATFHVGSAQPAQPSSATASQTLETCACYPDRKPVPHLSQLLLPSVCIRRPCSWRHSLLLFQLISGTRTAVVASARGIIREPGRANNLHQCSLPYKSRHGKAARIGSPPLRLLPQATVAERPVALPAKIKTGRERHGYPTRTIYQ